jgi:hypothetical protein
MLISKSFKNSPYEIFIKNDKGKRREIYKLPYYPDRIIHHAIVQVVELIWKKTLITDTYQSIKGRGLHRAIRKIQRNVRMSDEKLHYLKMDINKYYPSIQNDKLKQVIRRKIKCKDTLQLMDEIVDSTIGVPIGNYLSQYFGNIYLSSVDHEVKEKYRIKNYYRYCDDIVMIHSSKKMLHIMRVYTEIKLRKYGLTIKGNYCIRPIDEGLDFLGVVIYSKYSLIRKKIKYNCVFKVKNGCSRGVIASYNGWLLMCDSYNLRKKYNI